ncbi:MAG: efflux RND transporter periplasmic adaptor subunit [Acidobacteria bacterium]|nr:efflux RND transporter periplasmic adaptor subunit [Acidobacteriota bacterium]
MNAPGERPRKRRNLLIVRRQVEDEIFYVVADPDAGSYLRLGEDEQVILELLDGTRDSERIAAEFERRTGLALETSDLEEFVDSLRREGFVEASSFSPEQLLEEFRQRERAAASSRRMVSGSLALLKLMPFDPDRLLGVMARRLRWFWSRSFCVVSIALILAAGIGSIATGAHLGPAFSGMLASAVAGGASGFFGRMLVFDLVSGVMIAIHEAAHGLTLKYFGGRVPEMGFALAYFQFPGAYTDTTASYLLPSRFQRVMVSLSGGYTGLILAALGFFAWWGAVPGSVTSELSLIVMIVGGPMTLFFNWNPLVPFDGYYMAVDILEAPNLLPRSFAYLGDLLREKVFRIAPVHPRPAVRLRRVYFIFGSLAWLYQGAWTVAVPWVVYLLTSRLAGPAVGAVVAGALTLGVARALSGSARRFIRGVREESGAGGRTGWRAPLAVAASAALVVAALPIFRVHVHGTARLQPVARLGVRAEVAGFVSAVLVREGERVEAGEPLARLQNSDLRARVEGLRLDRDLLRVAWGRAEAEGRTAEALARRDAWARSGAAIETLARRENDLVLRAPVAGIVLAARLGDREGRFLREGEEWCEIAEGVALRGVVTLPEAELSEFEEGASVELSHEAFPGSVFAGSVARIPGDGAARDVEIRVPNLGGDLIPGMSARARILGERTSVLGSGLRFASRLLRGKIWW